MDKTYILNLSYGKDSMACLEAIKRLNWRLDRLVPADRTFRWKMLEKNKRRQ